MRTSNPALNDKALERLVPAEQLRDGWAAPTHVPQAPDEVSPWTPAPPVDTDRDVMTVGGTVSATAVLLVILLAAGFVGWNAVTVDATGTVELPGWLLLSVFGGLGLAIATVFRPQWARVTGPLYAAVQGTAVGAISHLYEIDFDGIVLQAVGLTAGVLAVMLFLYATKIVEVTDKLRMGIVMATGAVFLVYMLNFVLRLFGTEVPFIHDGGLLGIGISLAIVVIASLNLLLDFDFVTRGVAARAPRATEWYAAFGLLVTLVWLYLELLRLLSKLQSRN